MRRLLVGPCSSLSDSIGSNQIGDLLPSSLRAVFDRVLEEGVRPLPPATAKAVWSALAVLVSNPEEAAAALPVTQIRRRRVASDELQRRDAMSTALRIFAPRSWRALRPVRDPNVSSLARDIDGALSLTEAEALADDSEIFPGWDTSNRSQRGWREFRNGSRRLLLKNINASLPETRTGADLAYVRRSPDSVVLVQYKMLRMIDGEWSFRPEREDRIYRQVEKLLSFQAMEPERSWPPTVQENDFRLGPEFTYLKFVEGAAPAGLGDQELTRGYYIPASLTKAILANPDRGSRGGKLHHISRKRYVDSRTFVTLVRDSWIGSSISTTVLLQILGLLPSLDARTYVVAVDEPVDA
jgi:hypothetical protein